MGRIDYRVNMTLDPETASELYRRSTLAERRPTDDSTSMKRMLEGANLCVTAWDADQLVGISRSMTDHCFVCYLADLAVDQSYQRQGIGKRLIEVTKGELEPECKIVLLAAPAAEEYYPKIGFSAHDSAWVIRAG